MTGRESLHEAIKNDRYSLHFGSLSGANSCGM